MYPLTITLRPILKNFQVGFLMRDTFLLKVSSYMREII